VACRTRNIHTNFEKKSVSYKLDLVGEQGLMWDKQGTVRAGIIFFSVERKKPSIRNRIFCTPHNSISSEDRVS
jgi:hypothetical protein